MAGNTTPPNKPIHVDILRSQLKRARPRFGPRRVRRVVVERLTAIALVPLTLWFIVSIIRLEGTDRAGLIAWLHAPVPLALILCLIVATFWHMALGLRVVIDDYVHNDAVRIAMLLAQRGVCIAAALLCIVAALRLGL